MLEADSSHEALRSAYLHPQPRLTFAQGLRGIASACIDISDGFDRCKTAVLYLNTNNGYTKFKTGEQVESVENRLVLFDGNVQHAGTTCTDKRYRAVFNLNFEANNENN